MSMACKASRSGWVEKQQRPFARSVIEHLFAYALGREIYFADDEEITQMLQNVEADGFRGTLGAAQHRDVAVVPIEVTAPRGHQQCWLRLGSSSNRGFAKPEQLHSIVGSHETPTRA